MPLTKSIFEIKALTFSLLPEPIYFFQKKTQLPVTFSPPIGMTVSKAKLCFANSNFSQNNYVMKKKIEKSNLEMFADNLLPKKQQTKVKGGDGIIVDDKIIA